MEHQVQILIVMVIYMGLSGAVYASGRQIRIVGSLTIVFFFFFYVGEEFLGGGKTLHTLFNIDARLLSQRC